MIRVVLYAPVERESRRRLMAGIVANVDDTLILDEPWPDDLDPAEVPFRQRSVTFLRWLDGKYTPQGPNA